jgi:hypothetical protein
MSENIENIKELTSDEIKFPNSAKIYVATNGDTSNSQNIELKVPFREIALSPTRNMQDELEENPPVRVYDTSGVYTDESVKTDVREGLPTLRRDWIIGRGDVEEISGQWSVVRKTKIHIPHSAFRNRQSVHRFVRKRAKMFRRCITLGKELSRRRWNM